jgi:hypothetical protein
VSSVLQGTVPLGSCSRRMDGDVVSREMLFSIFLTSCFCDVQITAVANHSDNLAEYLEPDDR